MVLLTSLTGGATRADYLRADCTVVLATATLTIHNRRMLFPSSFSEVSACGVA